LPPFFNTAKFRWEDVQPGTTPRKAQTISHEHEGLTQNGIRARYLDYCAACISEVFLSLSDERTYQMMEEAAQAADIEIGSLGFSEMMDLVTQRLRQSIPLPEFEAWAREYREFPERFDHMLLDSSVAAPGDEPTGESPK
jgi:hypothetical protein